MLILDLWTGLAESTCKGNHMQVDCKCTLSLDQHKSLKPAIIYIRGILADESGPKQIVCTADCPKK